MEDLPWPTDRAATEAMMIASIALAMQQRSVLRVKGKVSRSLRHTIDLYQEACAWWFPERYRRVEIEAELLEDLFPTTARGVLCFSAGLDSIFSGKELGAASQVQAALFVEGYDIDFSSQEGLAQQRTRVERLLRKLSLPKLLIRTNVREALGQEVIEGAQGSYLAAALTLLSDSFGRGFISSGHDLDSIVEGDPVHEASTPLLGSSCFPIIVYGGQISRFEKLRQVAADPDLFRDVRVCLGRVNDEHCGRCYKCLFNAFACVAVNGDWPSWLPKEMLDLSGLASIHTTQHRILFAREILRMLSHDGQHSDWVTALNTWLVKAESEAERLGAECENANRAAERLRIELENARRANKKSEAKLEAILSSRTWRLTKPLRDAIVISRRWLR
jgi:hypothetical protein